MNKRKRKRVRTIPRGLFERPKGSDIWWVRYHDESGREHRESVGRKSLALKVYQKRKNEIQERRFFPERIRRRDVLLSATIDDFLTRNKDRLRWFDHYERYGKMWKDALPRRTLREIVPGDIERYVAKRRAAARLKPRRKERPLAPATINRELAFLRRVFNVAIEDGKLEVNPVRPKMFSKENNQRVRFLSAEEETALREAIGEEAWPMVAVAMHTGLRRGEQFNLLWENIDFATGLVTVRCSKHGETRRVPMNDTVREILRTRPSRLKSDYVFPNVTGEKATDAQNFVNRRFLPALAAAGIGRFSWHCLRHTFASRLVMAGVDIRTVQELMGHKTLTMTLRYSHLSPEHQLDAVKRLDRAQTGTTTGTSEKEADKTVVGASARPAEIIKKRGEWRRVDSNHGPRDYETLALAT